MERLPLRTNYREARASRARRRRYAACGRGLCSRAPEAAAWTSRQLARKGLDDASIDEALGGIDEEELRARARELVDRRLRTMGDAPRDAAYRRLAGMLARKGYAPSLAAGVVSEALEGWIPDSMAW